jgi:hypothetical protein
MKSSFFTFPAAQLAQATVAAAIAPRATGCNRRGEAGTTAFASVGAIA